MRLLSPDQETGLRLHAGGPASDGRRSQVLDRLSGHDLWRAVAGALADECARQVVYLTFAVGLTRARFTGAFLMLPQRGGRLPGQAERPAQAARSPAIKALDGAW